VRCSYPCFSNPRKRVLQRLIFTHIWGIYYLLSTPQSELVSSSPTTSNTFHITTLTSSDSNLTLRQSIQPHHHHSPQTPTFRLGHCYIPITIAPAVEMASSTTNSSSETSGPVEGTISPYVLISSLRELHGAIHLYSQGHYARSGDHQQHHGNDG
jgi:hypothetical protein